MSLNTCLESNILKMKRLLNAPPEDPNSISMWAHELCTTSRMIHVGTWRECPEREYVMREVLPVLRKGSEKLDALKGSGLCSDGDVAKIEHYLGNNQSRIDNIEERYLKGKASAFSPEDPISGQAQNATA